MRNNTRVGDVICLPAAEQPILSEKVKGCPPLGIMLMCQPQQKLLENWQNKVKRQAVAITVTGHGLPTQPSIVTIWSYWTDKEPFAEMLKITIFTPLAHSPLSQHPKAAFSLCHSTYDAIKSLKALPLSIISTWGGNHRNPMLCYCWPGGKH